MARKPASRPLYADRHEIVAGLLRSGVHRREAVAAEFDKWMLIQERRASAAPERALAHSARVRAGIRRVATGLSLRGELSTLVGTVIRLIELDLDGKRLMGLRRVPDKRTVRKVLRELIDERAAHEIEVHCSTANTLNRSSGAPHAAD